MKISVKEFADMQSMIQRSLNEAFNNGKKEERERPLPNNLFEALIEYGKKTETLVDYHESQGDMDGCNWIQIKPTRTGSELVDYVEISFEENLMEIDYIGVGKL